MTKTKENKSPPEIGFVSNAIKVSENLLFRLNRFLSILRSIEARTLTREMFIEEAIKEKLAKEIGLSLNELEQYRRISFRIPEPLSEKVDQVIDLQRRLGRSISKADWVIEAISEKLEEDEKKGSSIPFDKSFLDIPE